MAEGINVRFAGPLQRFIQSRTGPQGIYHSVSEYIRDLVRNDYKTEMERQSDALYQELKAGAAAPLSDFVPLDVEAILKNARKRRS